MAQLGVASTTAPPPHRPRLRLRFRPRPATATCSSILAWSRSNRSPAACREQNNCWCRPARWSRPRSATSCAARAWRWLRQRGGECAKGDSPRAAGRRPNSARSGRCGAVLAAGRHRRTNGNFGLHDRLDRQVGRCGSRRASRSACSGRGTRPPACAWPTATPASVRSWRPASRPRRRPYPPWGPTCWSSTRRSAPLTKRNRFSATSASAEFANVRKH